jgi:hypothetical protein
MDLQPAVVPWLRFQVLNPIHSWQLVSRTFNFFHSLPVGPDTTAFEEYRTLGCYVVWLLIFFATCFGFQLLLTYLAH